MINKNIHSDALIRSATYASVIVASTLVISKGFAWHCTGSLSVKASLIDSLLDAMASLVNFFAVRHALRPADSCHRFGHGKAEALAGLGQSVFIALSSLFLLIEVIERVFKPSEVQYNSIAVWVMVGSTFATIFLVLWQNYVIKHTKSLAIVADALHYTTDILTNLGVLLTIGLASIYHIWFLDTLVGAIIALYILLSSWHIASKSLDILMDRELDDSVREKITTIAKSHTDVLNIHDLKTRSSGQHEFIQLHVELDKNISLNKAHQITDELETDLLKAFPKAEIIIHQDIYNS